MVIYPGKLGVFLAGTIDNGDSTNWQEEVVKGYTERFGDDVIFYNPRRPDWNQYPTNLTYQIKWEQAHLDGSDLIVMCLLDDSKSPISLLELGLYAQSHKIIVFCNPKFYRYWNVKLTCEKYDIPLEKFNIENIIQSINAVKTQKGDL